MVTLIHVMGFMNSNWVLGLAWDWIIIGMGWNGMGWDSMALISFGSGC